LDGSLADRFCASTGPDAGPIPGSSGPVLTTLTAAIAKIENRYYYGKIQQIRRKHDTIKGLL
jgi:hypothetical protein